MKTAFTLFLLSLGSLTYGQSGKQNQFQLKGTLPQQTSGLIYLSYQDETGQRLLDSTQLRNGQFSFTGTIDGPTHAYLRIPALYDVFLEPAPMSIKFPGPHVRGSATHRLFDQLNQQKKVIEEQYKHDLSLLSGERRKAKIDSLRERLAPYFLAMNQADNQFMTAHSQSVITLYLLNFQKYYLTPDSLKMYYERLGSRLQRSVAGQQLLTEVEKSSRSLVGKPAFSFNTIDITNRPLSLFDYLGKYVLLDFWGSWCAPCRKGHPHLITLYQQYAAKGIEFISVASDDKTPEAWRKAVKQDKIDLWKHVLLTEQGLAGHKANIGDAYGISVYPTKLLINTQGVIIGRYTGSSEQELTNKLQEIFN